MHAHIRVVCPASIHRAVVDVSDCNFLLFRQYSDYRQLLGCIGRGSCQLDVNPAWWILLDNACSWCPDCQRSLRVNYR